MDNILRVAIASGLKFPIMKITNYDPIPLNTFGVFVGVERSDAHKLSKWPENIHGCIGYWDPNYKYLDNKTIIEKIIDVAYDSTWTDDRRKYFKHLIYVDLYAKYKIYYMKNKIKKINSDTGVIIETNEIFDNKKYGLIVENTKDKKQRATYLPDVFPDESWAAIRSSLLGKASISNANDVIFYAYDCDIYSMTIADYFIKPIIEFINTNYVTFVPYMVNNNTVVSNKAEDVRNLATMYDILELRKFGYKVNKSVIDAIINNIDYYKSKYLLNPKSMRQASAFLVLNLHITNPKDKTINIIKDNFNEDLELKHKVDSGIVSAISNPIDPNFELGEILMALLIVDPYNSVVQREINKISSIREPNEMSDIDIFKYNWYSKSVHAMTNPSYKYQLLNNIVKYMDKYKINETNYLAVEFEALTTLYRNIDIEKNRLAIEPLISKLLINLESRRNPNGLYEFTDGTMRLDITGHVLNGFYALMKSYNDKN